MGALDQNSLLMEVGNIWVGDDAGSIVDLGAVRNVRFTGRQVRNKIDSDNRGTVLNKIRLDGVVEFDWLEPGDVNKMETLFKGLVTKGTVAGTPVSGATQVIANPFVANKFYEIANQDGDGTVVTINSVTGGTDGALTADDDYHVLQNPNTGKWGIILNTVAGGTNISTLAQTITIDYDYTPNASLTLTGGSSQTATNRYLKIIGPSEDDSLVTREIVLSECVVASDMLLPFVNVQDAGDVGVMPVTVENNKAATWTLTDEINPS
jgi:hypothetical protein